MVDAEDLKSSGVTPCGFESRPRHPHKNMNNKYYVTIGLEIHAELNTASKMWCNCANVPLEETANKNICPICMAHPGTLPVANAKALEKMIQIGLAVRSDIEKEAGTYNNISNFIEFDRKNYFYPDIPKAYQITQYQYPLVNGGAIKAIVNGNAHNITLTRIHLEEDTAKSSHDKGDYTVIDFNRAGVPLMELVTDAHTYDDVDTAAAVSSEFAKELRRILRTLGAGDADMEKGQMRVEANISVTQDKNKYGTKCEVKNLNSFKSVEDAIKYEVNRHIELLESGEKVIQETRGWDENKRSTFSQRKKENAHDYRYFPDPDLPKLYTYELFDILKIMGSLPILPEDRRNILNDIGLNTKQVSMLLDDVALCDYYFSAINVMHKDEDKLTLANYLLTDVVGTISKVNTNNNIDIEKIDNNNLNKNLSTKLPNIKFMIELVTMISQGLLSSRGAKDIIAIAINENKSDMGAQALAEANGLIQQNDDEALKLIVNKVIENNPIQWAEYKGNSTKKSDEGKLSNVDKPGNEKLLMYFVGQCMKESKGGANPGAITAIIKSL